MRAEIRLRFIVQHGPGNRAETPTSAQDLIITRRCLPHWTLEGSWYYVTFCVRSGMLTADEIRLVLDHIKGGHRKIYQLIAVCIMPDHVHVVLSPEGGLSLSQVMQRVKGASARLVNLRRGATGSVWQMESWDRIIRSDAELDQKLNYMLMNPVEAGLTESPWDYPGWFLQPVD